MSREANYWTNWTTQRSSRRRILTGGTVGVVGVVGLGLVGCGGDDKSSSGGRTSSPASGGTSIGGGSTTTTQQIPTDIKELKGLSLDKMRTLVQQGMDLRELYRLPAKEIIERAGDG